MAGDYSNQAKSALSLIQRKGLPLVLLVAVLGVHPVSSKGFEVPGVRVAGITYDFADIGDDLLLQEDLVNGRDHYVSEFLDLHWDTGQNGWLLSYENSGDVTSWVSFSDVADPAEATGWGLVGGAGTGEPTITQSHATYACDGVVFPISQTVLGQMSDQMKERLHGKQAYDCLLAAQGLAVTPESGNTITGYLGQSWAILGVNTLAPSGTPIIHQLLLAR